MAKILSLRKKNTYILMKCATKIENKLTIHYENTPIQYTVIFNGCKNDYFQTKNCIYFLIFAQNIDCGYTLEPPQYPQSLFKSKNKKIMYTPVNFSFTI